MKHNTWQYVVDTCNTHYLTYYGCWACKYLQLNESKLECRWFRAISRQLSPFMLNKIILSTRDPLGRIESLTEILEDTLPKIDAQISLSKNKEDISILEDLYSKIEDTLLEARDKVY